MVDYYSLNDDGKDLLPKLLTGAGCPQRTFKHKKIWNRTWLSDKVGLDRTTIEKIVQSVEETKSDSCLPVEQETLVALFEALWKILIPQKKSELCTVLNLVDEELPLYKQTYGQYVPLYWEVPSNFSEGAPKKRPEDVAKLLRTLDYAEQERDFKDFLNSCSVATFLIPAPCDRSQMWAIHRLAYTINYSNEALRTPIINVNTHRSRTGDVNFLWRELGKQLKKNSDDREAILRELSCQLSWHRPMVIALYNFGDSDLTLEEVLQDFWQPLIDKLSNQECGAQIILLMADSNITNQGADHVKLLSPIQITAKDVENWFKHPAMRKWCIDSDSLTSKWLEQRISKFSSIANDPSQGSDWRWDKPGKVIDKLCFDEFELENGVESLRPAWERRK